MVCRLGIFVLISLFFYHSGAAFAWDTHQIFMPGIAQRLLDGATPEFRAFMNQRLPAPCGAEAETFFRKLVTDLDLNPSTPQPPLFIAACAKGDGTISPFEILTSAAVDEPDKGMDCDLDDSAGNRYDPENERATMGGTKGPTSQGFRHMYFTGMKVLHPLRSFQIPLHSIGQGPNRAEAMANKARALLQAGETAWGFRVLAWSLHYLQDLSQPFHSTQIPTLKMVPWLEVVDWPPAQGFSNLTKETTRIVGNYHYAYEHYVYLGMTGFAPTSLPECVAHPEKVRGIPRFAARSKKLQPKKLALKVAQRSFKSAHAVGITELDLFGDRLMESGVDLPNHQGAPDYQDLMTSSDRVDERAALEAVTCHALADMATSSTSLIHWALQPKPLSSRH